MKKAIIIFIILILCVLISFLYAYNTYTAQARELSNYNKAYEHYYNKEIYGLELATIINKVIDNNEKNNIAKDEKGNYVEDSDNSIKVDIYIIDTDEVYNAEKIYSLGTERFVQNFNTTKFKCTKIEYHEKSKKIKYLYFEQISN